MLKKYKIALDCFGGYDEFEKLARPKISTLLKELVVANGNKTLGELSEAIGIPLNTLELLCNDPEKVPISADLVERLACPLNISTAKFLKRPNFSEENRKYFKDWANEDGFSIGLHMGEKNPFDFEVLFAYLLALDAINATVMGKENAFLNEKTTP